jgi:hypothetical protein
MAVDINQVPLPVGLKLYCEIGESLEENEFILFEVPLSYAVKLISKERFEGKLS